MDKYAQISERLEKLEQRLTSIENKISNSQSNQNTETSPLSSELGLINKPKELILNTLAPTETPTQRANSKISVEKRNSNFEVEFGTKWISRIGVIAILIAVMFFLKYSFDNNLIGAKGRIFTGTLFGIAMLLGGDFLLKKYRITSTVVTGGGLATLSFTVFASFSFYEFISQTTSFVMFLLIVVMSSFLALSYNSVTVMIYSVLTGFLTPFLISTGTPNDKFYLTYITILNVGIMTVTYFKNWKALYYISFFISNACFGIWMLDRFKLYEFSEVHTQYFIASVALSALFIQYLFISICMNLGKKIASDSFTFDFYLIFLNAISFFSFGYHIINSYNPAFNGIFTLSLSFIYFGLFMFIKSRLKDAKALLLSLLALSMLFVTITIPVQLNGSAITLAWGIEALMLAIISSKIQVAHLKRAYLAVSVLTIFMLLHDLSNMNFNEAIPAFFNINSLTFAISVLSLAIMAYIVRKGLPKITVAYLVVLNLLFLSFLFAETNNAFLHIIQQNNSKMAYYSNKNYLHAKDLTQSAILIFYSIVLITIGIFRKSKSIRVFSLVLFASAVIKVFFFDLSTLEGMYRILSFVCLGLILIALSIVYQKFKNLIVGGNEDYEKIAN